MKLYVGVTDNNWYDFLAQQQPDEVNFWQPGGRQTFRALDPYGMFLFKLHSPLNFIAGGGLFVRYSRLPVSLAWEAFGTKNGRHDYSDFRQAIYRVEVSKRIKEDYGNGREYYAFHGHSLIELPVGKLEKPSLEFLQWHNENVYLE